MKLSRRERNMLVLTMLVALYGVTGILARGRIERWRAADEARRGAEIERAQQQGLVAQRDRWQRHYAELRDLMPVFEVGRQVDTYWLGLMDRTASRHGLSIQRRQVGAEQSAGEVFELPIECREWEGSLDALLRFLHDLQSEGVMLDMRQLFMRPRETGNPDLLRGRFVLYCAYLRGQLNASPSPRDEVASDATDGGPIARETMVTDRMEPDED